MRIDAINRNINRMTSEYLDKLSERLERTNGTERLNRLYKDECADLINRVLKDHDNTLSEGDFVKPSEIAFTDHFVAERAILLSDGAMSRNSRLSQLIFDLYYPRTGDQTFFHYTKVSALASILRDGFRMSPLSRNIDFHEYRTFYQDHECLIDRRIFSEDFDRIMKIMEESYFLSLVPSKGLAEESDKLLWRNFTDHGAGVKIKIEIISDHPDFREIGYASDKNIDRLLVNRLMKKIYEKYNRLLFITGVSRIGAFYLPGDYSSESEVRFLVKKNTDQYKFELIKKGDSYFLPHHSVYGNLTITEIIVGENCDYDHVKDIVAASEISPEPIVSFWKG